MTTTETTYDAGVQAEAVINAPAQRVFDFLTSPEKIPLVMPSLIENTNLPEPPLQEGSEFTYRYQMYGVILEGSWIVTALEAPTRYEARTTGAGDSLWKYSLTESGGQTTVALSVEYRTPQSALQRFQTAVVQTMNQREADVYMANLKMVLEMQDA
ncbi:MAG: SRPBCC family protein [Chloroflexia bacterium]